MRSIFLLFFLFSVIISVAQSKLISGKVVNDKNEAVAFATVKIKKTQAGVSADAQGAFSINANATDVLIISATGFVTKEVAINNETNITVNLASSNAELSTVVVTTALGIQ